VGRDRPRLPQRRLRQPRRPEGQELHQRSLYPQHVRRLAWLYVQWQDPGRSTVADDFRGMTSDMQLRIDGAAARPHGISSLADQDACERFLVHEAWLLDDARFDEWLSLFTEDARYWVPSEPGQSDPLTTVSLMYDDRRLLETRVRRLASPRIYSQEPRSRTSRIVSLSSGIISEPVVDFLLGLILGVTHIVLGFCLELVAVSADDVQVIVQ
jgi:Ring hydroxylating beta subunit